MIKTFKIILSLLIAISFMAGGQVFAESGKKATYIIGMDAPMTGDVGFVGVGMKNAMLMAKERLGETKYNYKFVFEDDRYDAKVSASAANKLINIDKADAIVTIGVGGPIVNPLATKHDIIHFAIEIDPSVAKGDNNFIHWTPTNILVGRLIKEMQNRSIKKVAVFRQTNLIAWNSYMDFFRNAIKKTDIKIVSDQSHDQNEKNYHTMIAMIKKSDPDIILLLDQVPAIEIIVKQLREAGLDIPLTGINSLEQTPHLGLFEGQWYIAPLEPSNEFSGGYKAKYDENPPVCSPNAYDIVNLLVMAVENAGTSPSEKPSTKAVSRELLKIKNFNGALGNNLYFDKQGIVQSAAIVKKIKDGKPVKISD